MHDPGGGRLFASIRSSGHSFRRAVPNTLILLPGRPPPEVSQSLDDMPRTAARAERCPIGPVSSQGCTGDRKTPSSGAVRAACALLSSRTKEILFRLDWYARLGLGVRAGLRLWRIPSARKP